MATGLLDITRVDVEPAGGNHEFVSGFDSHLISYLRVLTTRPSPNLGSAFAAIEFHPPIQLSNQRINLFLRQIVAEIDYVELAFFQGDTNHHELQIRGRMVVKAMRFPYPASNRISGTNRHGFTLNRNTTFAGEHIIDFLVNLVTMVSERAIGWNQQVIYVSPVSPEGFRS